MTRSRKSLLNFPLLTTSQQCLSLMKVKAGPGVYLQDSLRQVHKIKMRIRCERVGGTEVFGRELSWECLMFDLVKPLNQV